MDCSLPGSFVHGILQARILELVAMFFSRGSSQPRDWPEFLNLLHWQVGSLQLAPPGKPLRIQQLLTNAWWIMLKFSSLISVQLSLSVVSNSLRPHEPQHARHSCPSPSPRIYTNSCPLSRWCHSTIASAIVPFSCLQSFPASGSFPMSQLFTSGCQSIGVSVSAAVLPMNIQDWFPLGWIGWIPLQSKGLSRVFSNTTFEFFSAQLSL